LGILCNESSLFGFCYPGSITIPLTGKGLQANTFWEISFADKNECLSTCLQEYNDLPDDSGVDILPSIQPVGDPGQQQRNAQKINEVPETERVTGIESFRVYVFKGTQIPQPRNVFRDLRNRMDKIQDKHQPYAQGGNGL
jgi:hypothetical protein